MMHDKPLVLVVLPLATFVVLFLLQYYFPRRAQVNQAKYWFASTRQINNLVLLIVNSVLMTLTLYLLPLSLVYCAYWAQTQGSGLLNYFNFNESWFMVILTVVVLDLLIYWQHVASHKFQWLWSFHKVHHSDLEIDVTTAVRFHVVELLLSQVYKAVCIIILGASLWAVIIFELVLFLGSQFSHSNWRIKPNFDKLLRGAVVTPDMHRIHHCVLRKEQDSNYGFFLIFWDKLFRTYINQPQAGHLNMSIGIKETQKRESVDKLLPILKMPFSD